MTDDKLSPEERLFRVIQEEGKPPSINEALRKKKINLIRKFFSAGINLRRIHPLRSLLFNRVKQFFANLKHKALVKGKLKQAGTPITLPINFHEIDPRVVNKVLIVILTVLIVLVIHYTVNKRPNISKLTTAISKIKFQAVNRKAIESFKPVAFYLEGIKKRDIFKPSPRLQQQALGGVKKAQAKLKELAKDLKLVGISWGKSPKAMIRSKSKKNTYFLRQGQMIGTTGIEIKAIFRDKVIISYKGEEMELL